MTFIEDTGSLHKQVFQELRSLEVSKGGIKDNILDPVQIWLGQAKPTVCDLVLIL